jgi:hypothetical protein
MKLEPNTLLNMENKDFAVFILTHGRPDNVKTLSTLKKCGYTGKIYFIVDNEDKTIEQYQKNYGIENVKIFDKKAMADEVDEGNNFDERRTITHARNACFKIAKEIGITYFVQLDDDYTQFKFRFENKLGYEARIKNIDNVFNIFLEFYKKTNILSIAFSQGGDHIGGFSVTKMKRKCMNSFFCSTEREFQFVGAMNEDVNTYTTLGSRGFLFFTFTSVQLDQPETQSQKNGITDMYLRFGTYCKAFTTVMMHPSGAKVSMMNSTHQRIHHSIKWINTTPMILDEKYKKNIKQS